jgi:hypothetical protein
MSKEKNPLLDLDAEYLRCNPGMRAAVEAAHAEAGTKAPGAASAKKKSAKRKKKK